MSESIWKWIMYQKFYLRTDVLEHICKVLVDERVQLLFDRLFNHDDPCRLAKIEQRLQLNEKTFKNLGVDGHYIQLANMQFEDLRKWNESDEDNDECPF